MLMERCGVQALPKIPEAREHMAARVAWSVAQTQTYPDW